MRTPDFAQWCRSKGYDTFGCVGPVIATGLRLARARVITRLDGAERQNYPLSDMIIRPPELVSRISHDMTLLPGDVIACGTSLGVGSIRDGGAVEVRIDGDRFIDQYLGPMRVRTPSEPGLLLRRDVRRGDRLGAARASAYRRTCPPPPRGRLIVIGAGKASAAMARAVEEHWPGPLSGLVVTRYGYAVACARIEIVEAAHPVPDAAGHARGPANARAGGGPGADDLVLCLISGGGSALLPLPAPGLTLDEKQAVESRVARTPARPSAR